MPSTASLAGEPAGSPVSPKTQESGIQHWIVQRAPILAGAVCALALFVATAWWPDTPDGWIHLHRTRALAEALRMGVLLPRLFPDFAFGYGYPVFNFYAPLSYYPPALLNLIGIDLLIAVRLSLALGFFGSAVGIVWLARLWGGSVAATVSMLVFLAFPYRLYDLFIRGALPEFAAFFWFPWLAYALTVLVQKCWHREPDAKRWVFWSALAWVGLLLTHNLSAVMAGLTGVGIASMLLIVTIVRGEGERVWSPLGWSTLAVVAGTLLAGWYVAPALLESGWVGIGAQETSGYLNHFASWGNLFDWRIPFPYPSAADATVPLPGIIALILICVLALLLRPSTPQRRVLLAVMATGIAAIFLTTTASESVWRWLAPLLSRLQFPWRWQSMVALSTALGSAFVMQWVVRRLAPARAMGAAILFSLVVLAIFLGGLRWNVLPAGGDSFTTESMLAFDAAMGQVGASWTGEFLPTTVTEQRWAIGRDVPDGAPTVQERIDASARLVRAGYLHAEYAVDALDPWRATFHRFAYPAWQVRVDGAPVESTPISPLGLLSATVPASVQTLSLAWEATNAVWIGRVMILFGWLILLWVVWRAWRGRFATMIWLCVGVAGLVTVSGATVQEYPVQPVHADYDDVQLAGVVAPPAQQGAAASVTLHWLVREAGRDLTVFLHLLDASGRVVAQVDAPLGGGYTPASRLNAGELLDPTYRFLLSDDLAPGLYSLRIGLYPAGAADTPLIPAGGDAPFVTGATIEVRR